MPRSFGFRSLRERLGLIPVAAVLCVSLITHAFLYVSARDEVYDSREELAQGLADNLAQRLSDELSDIRDELSSWAAFLSSLDPETGSGRQRAFQEWLRGLSRPSTSRYDLLALVDHDGRVMAINELALSVSMAAPLPTNAAIGQKISGLLGESTDGWLRPTFEHGAASGLPWRMIAKVNAYYGRPEPKTRDDVVRRYQIVIAVPLRRAAAVAPHHGALIGVVSWAPFQRIVDEGQTYLSGIGLPTGYGFLFDTNGNRVIAHKLRDPSVSKTNILGDRVTDDHGLPRVTAAAVAATRTAFEYEFPEKTRKFAVFTKVDPASENPAYAFDWRLGIGVDHSDIFAPLARLRSAVLAATLAVAVAVAFVGVWLGRTLSLSVKEFTHLAEQAAVGKFNLIDPSASHDEISELGEAWNRLLVSMREKAEVQPVPNPYVVGTPVRTSSMFFGRDEDLRWIDECLVKPGNEMIVLAGQRRIGKTSLLHQVRNRRELSSALPVLVDTHALLPLLRSDDDFYVGLGRAIHRELSRLQVPPAPSPPPRNAADLVAAIHSINDQFPSEALVLLFDEIEALEAKLLDRSLSSEITSFLGSLLEGDCRLSMIATGSNGGGRLGGPFWSTIAPKAIVRRIGLLSAAEGMRLIREPVAGQVEFEEGVPESILRLTGAHPYYTQTVCQRLVDTLNERRARRASMDFVQKVTDQLLAEPPLPLEDMWSSRTPLQQWLLAELARLLQDSESAASVDAVLVNADYPPATVATELRRLVTLEIVEEKADGYRFSVDFVRRWIRNEQLWWDVAKQRGRATVHG